MKDEKELVNLQMEKELIKEELHEHFHCHDEHCHDEHCHDEHCHDEHCHDEHCHDEHCHDEHCHDEHCHDEHCHCGCCGCSNDSCGCGHAHGKEKVYRIWGIPVIVYQLVVAIGLLIAALCLEGIPCLIVSLVGVFVVGLELIFGAVKGVIHGKIFNENMLMIIASIGAFIIGKYPEALAIMVFYRLGESLQDWAVRRSEKNIHSLVSLNPELVHVVRDGKSVDVAPKDVLVGECIEVKPGELIPLDGELVSEHASIDVSALTGESLPRDCVKGDELPSGGVNLNVFMTLKVTKCNENSTLQKLLKLLKSVSEKKSKSEKFISKFARIYTPIVIIGAFLMAIIPNIVTGFTNVSVYVYRAITFLVLSCPCALVLSVPLSFFSGIGASSRLGVLIKGGNVIEALAKTGVVVFDKTGTLTKGEFKVLEVVPNGIDKTELLKICASIEQASNHPIAKSIVNEYAKIGNYYDVDDAREIAGFGIMGVIAGENIYCGKYSYLDTLGVNIQEYNSKIGGNVIYVVKNNACLGVIIVGDEEKEDSKNAIKLLNNLGISHTVMLTGDTYQSAKNIGDKVGISKIEAELMPEDKVSKIETLLSEKQDKKVVFVGDGFNDAPVMARADVGIAMGGIGSDATIEIADAVIMTDEPSKVPAVIKLCKRVMRIVKSNIIFALAVKLIILVLGAIGYASMWLAVFADVGVSIICVINSLRALFIKTAKKSK